MKKILTILFEDPPALCFREADGFRRHLRGDDVAGHEEIDFVFELHLALFSPDALKDVEFVVEDEEADVWAGGVAAVEKGDVAPLPVHLSEVHQGGVQPDAGAFISNKEKNLAYLFMN